MNSSKTLELRCISRCDKVVWQRFAIFSHLAPTWLLVSRASWADCRLILYTTPPR